MLRYTGGGFGGAIAGIPARDLTDAEVEEYGPWAKALLRDENLKGWASLSNFAALVATGLYGVVGAPMSAEMPAPEGAPDSGPGAPPPRGTIDLGDGVDAREASLAGKTLAHRKAGE